MQRYDGMQQVEWRALLCFGGDNINRAMNLTFTAAIALRGVADMSQNFLLLFLNFNTIEDRGQTQMILFVDHTLGVFELSSFSKQSGIVNNISDDDIKCNWQNFIKVADCCKERQG